MIWNGEFLCIRMRYRFNRFEVADDPERSRRIRFGHPKSHRDNRIRIDSHVKHKLWRSFNRWTMCVWRVRRTIAWSNAIGSDWMSGKDEKVSCMEWEPTWLSPGRYGAGLFFFSFLLPRRLRMCWRVPAAAINFRHAVSNASVIHDVSHNSGDVPRWRTRQRISVEQFHLHALSPVNCGRSLFRPFMNYRDKPRGGQISRPYLNDSISAVFINYPAYPAADRLLIAYWITNVNECPATGTPPPPPFAPRASSFVRPERKNFPGRRKRCRCRCSKRITQGLFVFQREVIHRDVDRERRLRADTESRLRETVVETERYRATLAGLQREFSRWVYSCRDNPRENVGNCISMN